MKIMFHLFFITLLELQNDSLNSQKGCKNTRSQSKVLPLFQSKFDYEDYEIDYFLSTLIIPFLKKEYYCGYLYISYIILVIAAEDY